MDLQRLVELLIGAILGLYGITFAQTVLIWYKLGRLEGKTNQKRGNDGQRGDR